MATNDISGLISAEMVNDPRWVATKKVANSPQFFRAALLRDFLYYIAWHELNGHPEEITEQKIGHRVYKRRESYSPAEDNIVRVSAQQLRVKLHEFYETAGREEAWVIEIPKGKYVPVFRKRAELEREQGSIRSGASSAKNSMWALAITVALTVAVSLAALRLWQIRAVPSQPSVTPNLLTLLFHNSDEPVTVVISDEALVLMESLAKRSFSLDEYTNQSYRQLPADLRGNKSAAHFWNVLASRQIINVGDAGVSNRIRASIATLGPKPAVEIRSAQNMRPRDFLSGNFIMLGASNSNPWVQMFGESRFNFQFEQDIPNSRTLIRNLHPQRGEPSVYAADVAHSRSYARIAYFPNVTRTGQVMMIAGTSMEGTEAAADFCLEPDSVAAVRHALGIGSSAQVPAFELLLATSSKAGTGVSAQVVAIRTIRSDAR